MSEDVLREMFRRLHAQLESHPYLSGMITNEHQGYLRNLWHEWLRRDTAYPGGEPPDYSKDLGDLE